MHRGRDGPPSPQNVRMTLPDGYHLHVAAPSAEDFAALRREAGLSPRPPPDP